MIRKTPMTLWFHRLLLIFIALGIAIGLAETALRIIRPPISYQHMPQKIRITFFADSEHAECTLKPGYAGRCLMTAASFDSRVQTNSRGWRDTEPDDREMVLVFGDSFIFGVGLNNGDTVPDHLERLAHARVNFVNLGYTAGRSPDSYATYLRYHPELQQKRTILLLFANDLYDISNNDCVDIHGHPVPIEDEGCYKVRGRYSFVRDGRLFIGTRSWVTGMLPLSVIELLKQSYLVGYLRDRLARQPDPEVAAAMRAEHTGSDRPDPAREILYRSIDVLQAHTGDLVIFTITYPGQPGEMLLPFFRDVETYGRSHGIPVVHLPTLDASHGWARDRHLNPKGSAVVAALMHRELVKLWPDLRPSS